MSPRPNLKAIAILLVIVFILSYGLLRSKDLILGPSLVVVSPGSGSTVIDASVEIIGQAARIAKLYLNDRQIFTDPQGNFKESLLLSQGYNIFTLRAVDKWNRQVVKKIELVLE